MSTSTNFHNLLHTLGISSLESLAAVSGAPVLITLQRVLVLRENAATDAFVHEVAFVLKVDDELVRDVLVSDGIRLAQGFAHRGIQTSHRRSAPKMPKPAKRVLPDGGERGNASGEDRASGSRQRTTSKRMVLRTAAPMNLGDAIVTGYGTTKMTFTVVYVERDGDGFIQRLKATS